ITLAVLLLAVPLGIYWLEREAARSHRRATERQDTAEAHQQDAEFHRVRRLLSLDVKNTGLQEQLVSALDELPLLKRVGAPDGLLAELRQERPDAEGVTGLAFAPDGRLLASCVPGERSVELWDLTARPRPEPALRLKAAERPVRAVAF